MNHYPSEYEDDADIVDYQDEDYHYDYHSDNRWADTIVMSSSA